MITAFYARFGEIFDMDCMTVDSAKNVLQRIEDAGDGYAIGVFDGYSRTFHSPSNMDIADKNADEVRDEKLASLSQFGIKPDNFEVYDQNI